MTALESAAPRALRAVTRFAARSGQDAASRDRDPLRDDERNGRFSTAGFAIVAPSIPPLTT
ncbi:hypothetical protein [Burkholderia sp. IMCC1007]|uniref:hypothetical protein n=1 Tax=Burkholderia sp. IMCC1007 TaxID=3004104 RepID=UPI0022B56B2A|nr:hypothetical protein [Burkholderia sp. IMCC1007]